MRLSTLASIAIAGMGLAFVATPAHAAAPPRNCVLNVSEASSSMVCYGSFNEAISRATGGRVTDASNNARAAVKDPQFAAKLNALTPATGRSTIQAPIVIGIEFSDDDYAGSRLIYSAYWGCNDTLADTDFWVDGLPGGWNDEIESFQTYANCYALHFLDIYRQGPSLGWWQSWGDLYWLNDEVSSIAWS